MVLKLYGDLKPTIICLGHLKFGPPARSILTLVRRFWEVVSFMFCTALDTEQRKLLLNASVY